VGKVLCLDYGRKRIGVAMSDALRLTAQPFETWVGLDDAEVIVKIRNLIQEESVEQIVIGYPLTLQGGKGRSAKSVDRFMHALSRNVSIPVLPWDERLTSVEAHRILHRVNKKPSRLKKQVDLIASVLILQNFLDYQQLKRTSNQGETD
jgi:putative Holliday junction resolvase